MSASLPFPAVDDRAARSAVGCLVAQVAGETVELHADRALYWPRGEMLFVADVHLGKSAAFRAGGVAVPRGSTASDLSRLSRLIARTNARRLVVLGDFLHAAAGRVPALGQAFVAWRESHRDVALTLVRGNHDSHAGDPPPEWDVEVVSEPFALPPFLACHHPQAPRSGHALCGHLHPGVWVTGRARESVRLPCFVVGPRCTMLPAFGRFTGLATVSPEPGQTIVAVAGERLFRLPALT